MNINLLKEGVDSFGFLIKSNESFSNLKLAILILEYDDTTRNEYIAAALSMSYPFD